MRAPLFLCFYLNAVKHRHAPERRALVHITTPQLFTLYGFIIRLYGDIISNHTRRIKCPLKRQNTPLRSPIPHRAPRAV